MNPIALALIQPLTSLISEFITDKDKAADLAHRAANLAGDRAHEISLAQIEANKVEAAHKSLFVAGWRPAAGWVCVVAIGNNYILAPYIDAFSTVTLPVLDLGQLMPVLMGLLGLGTLRSWEKSKKVAREK